MKKNNTIILFMSALLVFFLSSRIMAQNTVPRTYEELIKEREAINAELDNLNLIEAGLVTRMKDLKIEKNSITQEHEVLKPVFTEYAKRKMDYDQKCAGQVFHSDNPEEMNIESQCKQEKIWLENMNGGLRARKINLDKRDQDYKNNLDQLKLDISKWQTQKDCLITRRNNWLTNKGIVIRRIAQDAVYNFKDKALRDWVVNNVKFEVNNDPGQQSQLSPWVGPEKLIFTEKFLTETTVMQENLMAFEGGKLFMTMMKNRIIKDGQTLEMWFNSFSAKYNSVIWNMKTAKYKGEDLSILGDIDKESSFGYVFRAQALDLNKPVGQREKQEWNKVMDEFQMIIISLLQN